MKEGIAGEKLILKSTQHFWRSDWFGKRTNGGLVGMNRTAGFRNRHFPHQFLKEGPTSRVSKLIMHSLCFHAQNTAVCSVLNPLAVAPGAFAGAHLSMLFVSVLGVKTVNDTLTDTKPRTLSHYRGNAGRNAGYQNLRQGLAVL